MVLTTAEKAANQQVEIFTFIGDSVISRDRGRLNSGIAWQQFEIMGLKIEGPSQAEERSFIQLSAFVINDDQTLDEVETEWHVINGPLGNEFMDPGRFYVQPVYQDTQATIRAVYFSTNTEKTITVLNTDRDDYGLYANDGVDDYWQVLHFGENNPNGAASADADNDQQSNYYEFIVGTDPLNFDDRLRMSIFPSGNGEKITIKVTPAFSNRIYQLLACTSLKDAQWGVYTNGLIDETLTGKDLFLTLSEVEHPAQFFRVRVHYEWQ